MFTSWSSPLFRRSLIHLSSSFIHDTPMHMTPTPADTQLGSVRWQGCALGLEERGSATCSREMLSAGLRAEEEAEVHVCAQARVERAQQIQKVRISPRVSGGGPGNSEQLELRRRTPTLSSVCVRPQTWAGIRALMTSARWRGQGGTVRP